MGNFDNLDDESTFVKYVPYIVGIVLVVIIIGVIGGIIARSSHKDEQARELKPLDGTNTMTVTVDDTSAPAAGQNTSGRTQAYLKYPDGHKEIIWEDEYYSLGEKWFYDKWFATDEGKAWLATQEGIDWKMNHPQYGSYYGYVTVGGEVIAEGAVESVMRDGSVVTVVINGTTYTGNDGILLVEQGTSSHTTTTGEGE